MIIQGLVLEVRNKALLVLDIRNRRNVLVLTAKADNFCRGDIVFIAYDGRMTRSIPPQITANNVFTIARKQSCSK